MGANGEHDSCKDGLSEALTSVPGCEDGLHHPRRRAPTLRLHQRQRAEATVLQGPEDSARGGCCVAAGGGRQGVCIRFPAV